MELKYAILKDGYPHYAPNIVSVGGRQIINPPAETLRELGYLPVVDTPAPDTDELHYPVSEWVERGGQIVQVWTVKEVPSDPAPSLEDRVTETEKNVSNLQAEMDDFGYIFTGKEVPHENN